MGIALIKEGTNKNGKKTNLQNKSTPSHGDHVGTKFASAHSNLQSSASSKNCQSFVTPASGSQQLSRTLELAFLVTVGEAAAVSVAVAAASPTVTLSLIHI